VRVTPADHAIKVVVEDEGPGIPVAHLEAVFKPFYRLDQSRSKSTGGVGLGLANARTIARAHGGDVTAENRASGGLRVIVTLPRRKGPA
jgi:signal transduction histidine kinase